MENLDGKVDAAGPPTGVLTAAEWNQLAGELKQLIDVYSLQTPASGDLEQVVKAITQLASCSDFYTGGGTANAQTLTGIGRPGATAYVQGLRVRWDPSATNTGAATLNVNSLGVVPIVRTDGSVLQSGDITTGRLAEAWYDSGSFRLLNASLSVPSPDLPRGYISGLHFSPPSADLTHDLTFFTGSCRNAANTANLVLSFALTKRFDGASIALGTGQSGFPTISLTRAAATWYRVFMVGHSDGRVDFGFDTSVSAANLLADLVSIDVAGWTYYRQLGWIRTQSGDATAFEPFVQYSAKPGTIQWIQRDIAAVAVASLATTRMARSLATHCPPLAVAEIEVVVEPPGAASEQRRSALLTDKDQADYAPTNSIHTITTKSAGTPGSNSWSLIGTALVQVDGSSEIYERWDAASSWERALHVPRFHYAR